MGRPFFFASWLSETGATTGNPTMGWVFMLVLAVNLLGCLAIGLLYGLAESRDWLSNATRWLVLVGFLGSFTTFSTFSWNSFEMMREGQFLLAFGNVLASVVGGLALVWAGYSLTR